MAIWGWARQVESLLRVNLCGKITPTPVNRLFQKNRIPTLIRGNRDLAERPQLSGLCPHATLRGFASVRVNINSHSSNDAAAKPNQTHGETNDKERAN